jgi:hypothetical protein
MYYFEPLDPKDVSPRALVLSLMSSAFSEPQSIGRLIDAAALFGIEPVHSQRCRDPPLRKKACWKVQTAASTSRARSRKR